MNNSQEEQSNRKNSQQYIRKKPIAKGYEAHILRNVAQSRQSFEYMNTPKNKKKSRNELAYHKSVNEDTYTNLKKKQNEQDYLLQRRIIRDQNPEKHFKRRNYWDMNLRENFTDDDYFVSTLSAIILRVGIL